jgi:hypothetical protein
LRPRRRREVGDQVPISTNLLVVESESEINHTQARNHNNLGFPERCENTQLMSSFTVLNIFIVEPDTGAPFY